MGDLQMSGINCVQILGRLGAAPEIKDLPSGDKVCSFSVATSEKWKDKTTGEDKENTSWHRVSTFGKLAEVCSKYLDKGKQVYLSGKLKYRTYEKDGVTHYATDIVADKVEFLGSAEKYEVADGASQAPVVGNSEIGFGGVTPAKKVKNYADDIGKSKAAEDLGF